MEAMQSFHIVQWLSLRRAPEHAKRGSKGTSVAVARVDVGHMSTVDGHEPLLGKGCVTKVHCYNPVKC